MTGVGDGAAGSLGYSHGSPSGSESIRRCRGYYMPELEASLVAHLAATGARRASMSFLATSIQVFR